MRDRYLAPVLVTGYPFAPLALELVEYRCERNGFWDQRGDVWQRLTDLFAFWSPR